MTDEIINKFNIGFSPQNQELIPNMLQNKNEMFGAIYDNKNIFAPETIIDSGIAAYYNNKLLSLISDRITFPICDKNGNILGFSGRLIKSSDKMPKYLHTHATKIFDKGNILYNIQNVKTAETLIICEGFFDVISYDTAGFCAICTMGTALTDKNIENIKKTCKNLKFIFISFDNDSAGIKANLENGLALLKQGFNVYKVGEYDSKYKDTDELIKAKGKEAIVDIVNNPIDFISFYIIKILRDDIPVNQKQLIVNEIATLVSTYGDNSFRTKHIKLIAEKSGFDINDITFKINGNATNLIQNNIVNSSNNNFIQKNHGDINTTAYSGENNLIKNTNINQKK
jgi:DNA primase